ncbi:MAG: helix-turn-helix transcriptional regulator [Verrucomicrobia bacterium]|nr:helix-turn-helix transcriptional regulator [Verrucomicrobiota bacterium]
MAACQNSIGPRIKALRSAQKLTQAMLAARCGTLGWDVGENVITKIETQLRCVTDRELIILAEALRVKLRDFFPNKSKLF